MSALVRSCASRSVAGHSADHKYIMDDQPFKEALTVLADALAKRPWRKSYSTGFALDDWSANSRSYSSVGIPTCRPRSMASTRSIWRSSAKGGVTRQRKTIDCGQPDTETNPLAAAAPNSPCSSLQAPCFSLLHRRARAGLKSLKITTYQQREGPMLPAFWQNLPAKQGETGFGVETAPPASQCRLSGACPAPRISATFRTATDAQAR
jgi:hypothetical protein